MMKIDNCFEFMEQGPAWLLLLNLMNPNPCELIIFNHD